MISIAVQNAQDLEAIMKDPDKIDTNGFQQKRNGNDPYKQFVSVFLHANIHSYKLSCKIKSSHVFMKKRRLHCEL